MKEENIMKRKLTQLLMLGGLLVAACFNSLAQPAPEKIKLEKLEVEAALFKVLADKPAVGKIVKGAPYSATTTTERVQTLNDGNQIIRKNESKLYRDGEGRTRTEQTLETIGKWTAEGAAKQLISINDPVAGVGFSLDPLTRTAHKNTYALKKDGRFVTRTEIEVLEEKTGTAPPAGKAAPQIIPSKESKPWELQAGISGDPRRKIESLGTRATYTIPAGEIGNTLPIEVVEETWYSPELQLMVLTKSRDPRSGETTYRMTNLNRSEPDHSLFEIPADYTVTQPPPPPKPKKIREDEQ
jgi:hypothetical protein